MNVVEKIASPRSESVESRVERYESRAIGSVAPSWKTY
jgi:hypothetical protein